MVITDNPDAGYGFTSAFLIAGTTLVSTVLFVPKVYTYTCPTATRLFSV